jgi:polar amino acid transport system substrate-binding protein
LPGLRRAITQLLLACVACLGMTVGAGAERADLIRIATEGAYPPFNTVDAKGEPKGFEIDLVNALCQRADLSCAIVTDDWETLFSGLAKRQFDAVMSSVEITAERRRKFIFGKPYYRAPSAFLAQRGDDWPPLSRDALQDKKIGVVSGSVQEQYLETLYKGVVEIVRYGSLEEASLDVGTDRIDLVLGDKFELQKWLDNGRQATCCVYLADAPYDPTIFGEGYGMMFRRSDRELRDRFDRALEAVMADGTYDSIRSRYFPFDIR